MAQELILRLKPPVSRGAQHLLQQLSTAVASVGEGGKHAMANATSRVNCVGPRDAILTFIFNDSVSEDHVRAIADIASRFSGPFRVEAEIGGEAAAAPAPAPAAPTPAPAPAAPADDSGTQAGLEFESRSTSDVTIEDSSGDVTVDGGEEEVPPYSEWKVDDLREECGNRSLKKGGTKPELIERLEADDAAAEADGE